MPDKKGSILIITLWILVILSVLALGLGRRCAINLRIAAYQRDKLRAEQIARAGVKKAIWLLENEASTYDTQNSRGIVLDKRQPQDVFVSAWGTEPGEGFKIGNFNPSGEFVLGFQDEESRLNINGIGDNQSAQALSTGVLLKHLLEEKKIVPAENISKTIADWADEDVEEGKSYYKNKPFATEEELLAALECFYFVNEKDTEESRKSARAVYNNLKDVITVYGTQVNINTASDDILLILARAMAQEHSIDIKEENFLVPKIQRKDPFKFQKDIDDSMFGDSEDEKKIYGFLKQILVPTSRYFRFTVEAQCRGIAKTITVIYDRGDKDGKIVYWHEK